MTETGSSRPLRIADVAREAGVSTATVSFVLAGKSPVAPATRERVLETVNRLGYQRNRHARALRRGAAPTVSVVVPDLTNPFYAEILTAVEDAALRVGWVVTLMNYQLDGDREVSYLGRVFDDLPNGILYFPMHIDAVAAVRDRFDGGPRFVYVDAATASLGDGSVVGDNAQGARLAARHFRDTGRRRVLFSGPPEAHPSAVSRRDAFNDEADGLGLEIAQRTYGEHRTLDAVTAALQILEADPTIDAFLAGNDMLAMQVYSALTRRGVRVPDDVAICGFDGVQMMGAFTPRLTTIRQPIEQMGTRAFELVMGTGQEFQQIVLPVELIVGETT